MRPEQLVLTFSPGGSAALLFRGDKEPSQIFSTSCNEDNSASAELRNVENAVFDHPELFETEDLPLVMTDWPRRIVIPNDADITDDEALELSKDIFPGSVDCEAIITPSDDVAIVSLVPRGLPGFIMRTFPDNRPYDRMAIMLDFFRRERKAGENIMRVHIAGNTIDVAAFRGNALQIVTSLKAPSANDIIYYVAAIWENLHFSNTTDKLLFTGSGAECHRVCARLHKRIDDVRVLHEDNDIKNIPPHLTAQALLAAKISKI